MSWSRYPLPDNLPTATRCIQLEIPDDDEYTQLLVGALSWLAFWDAYDRDADKRGRDVAALWRNALDSLTFCDGSQPEYIIETVEQYIGGLVEIESEEEMANLRIETIDGIPYLEEDCGCGVRKYYSLTQSTINPQTGAIANELDTPPSYIPEVPLTQDQIDNCYAEKVADVVTAALTAFTSGVFNYALAGTAALFPLQTAAFIGAVEIQQSVTAALNGDLTLDFSSVGYTANEVIAQFNSQAFRDFIKTRIGSDQRISRWALEFVALRLLNNNALNTPTPIYPVFAAWKSMTNIAALNSELQTLATECSTGATVPGTFPGIGDLLVGNDWALSFDLTLAPFVDNSAFDLIDGNWEEGIGYVAIPDVQEDPHAATALEFQVNQGTGGDVTIVYVDYEYTPLLEGSTARQQQLFAEVYDKDTPFNGIRSFTTTWSSGGRITILKPYRVLNSDFADGGTAIVRRIALAGSGANPLTALIQSFS